jgi:hypothetical protein
MNKGSLRRNPLIGVALAGPGGGEKRPSKTDLMAGVNGQVHNIWLIFKVKLHFKHDLWDFRQVF